MTPLFLTTSLFAMVTNEVDVVSLGAIGTGVSEDGWSVTSVTNYSKSYHNALKLKDATSVVLSPTVEDDITGLSLSVISSVSNATRVLTVTPLHDGRPIEAEVRPCLCSRTKNVFRDQEFVWPGDLHVNSVRLNLVGPGTAVWGIRDMMIILKKKKRAGLSFRVR